MTGKFHANRKIKPSSCSSNISRSKSLGHTPIIPCWALITESMICLTKVEWYRVYISTFFNHLSFSKSTGNSLCPWFYSVHRLLYFPSLQRQMQPLIQTNCITFSQPNSGQTDAYQTLRTPYSSTNLQRSAYFLRPLYVLKNFKILLSH